MERRPAGHVPLDPVCLALGRSFFICNAQVLQQRPQTLSDCPRLCLNDLVEFHATSAQPPGGYTTRGWHVVSTRPFHRHPEAAGTRLARKDSG